jgi:DNA-directed RNA polymerase subunit M/transcription elongation factor TFIIS
MSILNNAIDSINLGLEDFESSDKRRLISCTRNIFSGIILLFKYKLSILSPENSDEVLIKQRVLPKKDSTGNIIWTGKGKKTVDVQQIKDRFESLGVTTHWDRINKINEFRNDIEHYHSNLSKDAIRNLLSNCFIVIRDFMFEELSSDPRIILGEKSWNILVSVAEVYEKEKEACNDVIDQMDWASDSLGEALKNISCENCGSGLMTLKNVEKHRENTVLLCKSCQTEYEYEEFVEHAISKYFSYESYLSVTDGNTLPLIDCPECGKGTYVYFEQQCLFCGKSFDHECGRCGTGIIPEEFDGSGFCGWCSHMMSKDD